jgi:hypothetical protein
MNIDLITFNNKNYQFLLNKFVINKVKQILLILFIFPQITFANLSLHSANVLNIIHGSSPLIFPSVDTKIFNYLIVKLKAPNSAPLTLLPPESDKIYIAYDTSPSDYSFSIDISRLNDTDILDSNGNYLRLQNGYKIESIKTEWKDASNNVLTSDSKVILGNNICNVEQYKDNVQVKVTVNYRTFTEYGNSSVSDLKETIKTFYAIANDGICYIQPSLLALNIRNGWLDGGNWLDIGADPINRREPYYLNQLIIHK